MDLTVCQRISGAPNRPSASEESFHRAVRTPSGFPFPHERPPSAAGGGLFDPYLPVLYLMGVQIASRKRRNPWTSLRSCQARGYSDLMPRSCV